jgi:DNA invertase Pin-like site-specific DNA recombinase
MRKASKASRNTTTAVVYCRVSATESQSESELSLEQQERTLTAMALAAGYADVVVVAERHTASKSQPELERVLKSLVAGEFAALYAAKIDRLSRKGAADIIRIADMASKAGWRLVVADVAMDTDTTVGRLVLTILAGVAEMESKRRSERMREYHDSRRARGEQSGVHYGRRITAMEATAERVVSAAVAGESYSAIARVLDAEQAEGRKWSATQVRRVFMAANCSPWQPAAA